MELAKRDDGKEKVTEIAGEVYFYAEGGSTTRIHTLEELRKIPWLDDEKAEKIYSDHLAPKDNPYSSTTKRI